jgi:hypothetical protein
MRSVDAFFVSLVVFSSLDLETAYTDACVSFGMIIDGRPSPSS